MIAIARKLGRRIITTLVKPDPDRQASFSQDGEDRILAAFFQNQPTGFYVDVGAHHPTRFSNTCLFYQHGWRGINIDPVPGTAMTFQRVRPRDTTLELAIGPRSEAMNFYTFDEAAYNTFETAALKQFQERGFPQLKQTLSIANTPLSEVLEKHLPPHQKIDFLSIDAEGWDLKVLESNDWERFSPKVVVVEDGSDVQSVVNSPTTNFLKQRGYKIFAKTNLSAFHVLVI